MLVPVQGVAVTMSQQHLALSVCTAYSDATVARGTSTCALDYAHTSRRTPLKASVVTWCNRPEGLCFLHVDLGCGLQPGTWLCDLKVASGCQLGTL
jgi:hypothetical protein